MRAAIARTGGPALVRQSEYAVLEAALPGRPVRPLGVLLVTAGEDRLFLRLRRDLLHISEPEEYEVLALVASDLTAKAEEWGGEALLQFLEEHASHALRLSARERLRAGDPRDTLAGLYERLIAPEVTVLPDETHLPLVSLRPAAGPFSPERYIEQAGWLEVPEDLRVREGMFVARVEGRSMEPLIQDGQHCVFRHGVAGSRNGRIVLAAIRHGEEIAQFTVKRYRSEKTVSEEGYSHERVTLEPLNPAFRPLVFGREEHAEGVSFAVIAEFVRSL